MLAHPRGTDQAGPYRGAVLDVALPLLACPVCGGALIRDGAALACPAGHRHDVARQGYVNLLTGRGAHGLTPDSTAMVLARERVQGAGLYAPIAEALAAAAADAAEDAQAPGGGLLDVGGGTGYYAAQVLDARPDLVGASLDLSVSAAKRAARAHPRLASLVADAWAGLPAPDGVLSLVTCVFAPRPAEEIARVLAPGGTLIVVTPRPGHLAGLTTAVGDVLSVDERKDDRLAARLAAFEPVGEHLVTAAIEVGPDLAADVVLMGPSAHHVDAADVRELLRTRNAHPVEIDVRVGVYRKPG